MADSIFQHYLNKLTDLSSRNKSLYLPKTQGSVVIDLQELDFLNGESAFEILRKAILGKKKISLIPEVDPRLGEVNQLSKSLSKIAFRDQLTKEETGDQSLFLAWLFVEGKLLNGHVVRAPLILLPCGLGKSEGNWMLYPSDSWQWNSAFLLAYSHGYGVKIDTDQLQNELEDLPTDAIEFRIALAKLLERHFSFQLSSTLFEDRLQSFPNSQISIDRDQFKDGKLVLKTSALLGQFAQKGNFLFSDYEALLNGYAEESLETLFEDHFQPKEKTSIPREGQLFPVFPLDSSQENVLMKVRQGKSLIVEGPPGTGKSQLITNLVSDYISRGKKVLVVSQKRAALDVVFERMAKAEFGEFLGLVHDFRGDQKHLFKKLKEQIESIENYQEEIRGLDSMQLEREISIHSKTIERLSEKFENFRTALFEPESVGIPIKAMYLNVGKLKGIDLDSKSTLLSLNYEQAKVFEKEFKVFKNYKEQFQDTFWENRNSFAQIVADQFSKIAEIIEDLENFQPDYSVGIWDREIIEKISKEIILEKLSSSFIKQLRLNFKRLLNPQLALGFLHFPKRKDELRGIQKWIQTTSQKLEGLNLPLPENQELIETEIKEIIILQGSWWNKMTLSFKKKRFPNLLSWLATRDLTWNSESIELAKYTLGQIQKLKNEMSQLPEVEGLNLTLSRLTTILQEIEQSTIWADDWEKDSSMNSIFERDAQIESPEILISELDVLQRHFDVFEGKYARWRIYLSPFQVSQLLFGNVKVSKINLLQTFSELVAFDQFLDCWSLDKQKLAGKMLELSVPSNSENPIEIFWSSWYLTWIGELERRNPILAEAGSFKMQQEMGELKDAILEKRKSSRFMTLLRLREQMTDSMEFNRLGNRLTYRDLLHQVSKKRQKWPIRKLVEEFDQEIFRLIPCWLASPETVSALFPMEQTFDLVIFDEASQCPVERGLPAMLRGKQVVVAGDSQQLRPSDFYQMKWESEEDGVEYEAESLLELSSNFFEKTILTSHYRSTDPSLIDFSNRNFYEGKLEVLPDLKTVLEGNPPFTWDKIEGVWENQINKSEADGVVEKVKVILSTSPMDSIGIVTGNYFQMELIRERLWEAGIHQVEIKVRNIENVQGDEFDQVILSLGYAPNREGKLVTNFGLLGKSGAENRLNVAITRARKVMHVISSIEPEDFRSGQLKNRGLSMLREFLEFVREQAKKLSFEVTEIEPKGYEIEWSLKNQLLKSDSDLSKRVPSVVMDLLKTGAEGPVAVLTDDQRFFNSPTAKAAMAYHPILLEAKGWNWEWKWSRGEFTSLKSES